MKPSQHDGHATPPQGYDHFCPWSGTVIGKKNRTVFLLWITVLVRSVLRESLREHLLCAHANDDIPHIWLCLYARARDETAIPVVVWQCTGFRSRPFDPLPHYAADAELA